MRKNKLQKAVPEGKDLSEYLIERLNATGSMERVAVEMKVSYATLFNHCRRLGIRRATEYRAEPEHA